MRRTSFRKQVVKRKNFLPLFFATSLLWLGVAGIIYFVDPAAPGAIFIFLVITFLAILFTASAIFENRRRGLVVAISLSFFLILRYFGIGNILNFLLLFGISIAIDLFYSRR